MQWLKDFINGFFGFMWDLIKVVFEALFDFIGLFFYFFFDGFLSFFQTMLAGVNLGALGFNVFASWSNMPPQLIYLVNQLGLPQGVTIIAGAIAVRKVIDLLPAAVTRV